MINLFYWLFRKYMKRLIKDYELAYKAEFEITHNETMRPDIYQLQRYLNGEFHE